MSRLIWDQTGEKLYETGVSNAVLYPAVGGIYPNGFVWNGITGVTESPSGAEAKPIYAGNVKYLSLTGSEDFGATIEAYMYPDEFAVLDGSASIATGVKIGQQKRGMFGLAYKTILGNDAENEAYGYKLHIIYGAQAAPSEKGYKTNSDSPEAIAFSWSVTTTPVQVSNFKPTASLEIDSTTIAADKLAALEAILYGTESTNPRLPLPDEIATLVGGSTISMVALSTSVPADNATAIAVGASVVLTFNNKIATESVSVVSATGALIACNKTVDATGKILTFKPASNLSAATKYFVTVAGVSDIYAQGLTTVVKSFTTA